MTDVRMVQERDTRIIKKEDVKIGGYLISSASITAILVMLFPRLDQEVVGLMAIAMPGLINILLILGKRLLAKYDLV